MRRRTALRAMAGSVGVLWAATRPIAEGQAGPGGAARRSNGPIRQKSLPLIEGPPILLTHAVAFSRDGSRIVAGSVDTARMWDVGDRALKVWDAEAGRETLATPEERARMWCVRDCVLRVWDAATGRETFAVPDPHTMPIEAVAFSPDGRHIATAGSAGWRRSKWGRKYWGGGPCEEINTVSYGLIKVWDAVSGRQLQAITWEAEGPGLQVAAVNAVAFSADGRLVVAHDMDRVVTAWDVESGRQRLRLDGNSSRRRWGSTSGNVLFSRDGLHLMTRSELNEDILVSDRKTVLKLWDISKRHARSLEIPMSISPLALSPDGSHLLAFRKDTLVVVELDTGAVTRKIEIPGVDIAYYRACSRDGKHLVVVKPEGVIQFWDIDHQLLLGTAACPKRSARAMAFLPDRIRVVAGGSFSGDWPLAIWEAALPRDP